MESIGLDVHRHYTVYTRVDEAGRILAQERVANEALPDVIGQIHSPCRAVLEATGNAQLLRADLIPRAYLAPPEVRELRDLLRLRASLVRLRTAAKNKVHALLAKRGLRVPVSDVFGKAGRCWLEEQRLPAVHQQAVRAYLAVIDALNAEISQVTQEVDRQATQREEVAWLTSLPGVGRYTALLILSEIGEIDRFPDGDHLAAYAGLVPMVRASGGRTRLGPVTKRGSAWLRWALVEAAQRAARRPGPFRERYERLGAGRGRGSSSSRWLASWPPAATPCSRSAVRSVAARAARVGR